MKGEITLELDNGEKRRMKEGDIAVQRGTIHAWVGLFIVITSVE